MNLPELTEQIKHNCNISDAQYWGYFSMCNLLLRLRELYFHENELLPWNKVVKEEVSEWISIREQLWETLEEKELTSIQISGKKFNPFDVELINEILLPHNVVYGAGYGLLKKPTFFLGEITKKHELDGKTVYITQNEICRDLSPPFAMSQKESIYIRLDVLRAYLYQKYLELKTSSKNNPLRLAYESYGMSLGMTDGEEIQKKIEEISKRICDILIWHELGEVEERREGNIWLDIIAASDDRLTEFRLRGIKDILADTSPEGTIPRIIENRDPGLLYFYTGLLDDTRKLLFPEILDILPVFTVTQNWDLLKEASEAVRIRCQNLSCEIIDLWKEKKQIKDVRMYLMASPVLSCRLKSK